MKSRVNRRIRYFYNTDPDESQRDRSLKKLDYFVNAVETNYKLKMNGGGKCSSIQIQEALFESAYQLMRTDTKTLQELEGWLEKQQRPDIAALVAQQLNDPATRTEVLVPSYKVYPASFANPLTDSVMCNVENESN